MKNKIALLIAAVIFSYNSYSQLDWGKFFASGPDDAQLLLESYLSPYVNAFGASLTGGWYNTAKPHKLGGFDITVTFNTAIVPQDAKKFDVSAIGLNDLEPNSPSDNIAPTVAGKNSAGPQMNYSGTSYKAFDMPKGTNVPYFPTPMLQLGVGLIKGTEIMGRYMPTISIGESEMGMWGIGLKHDIKQWIPVLDKIPVLQLAVMGGYTKFNSTVPISVDESDIYESAISDIRYEDGSVAATDVWKDQKFDVAASSFTGNMLVSANLPIVCFYGGIGFATTKTNLITKGYYPMIGLDEATPYVVALKDPIDMEIKNQDGGTTKPRFNVGMRFKFGVFTMSGDYTYANYSMVTLGLGLSFR
jgi:hypothetical protein